MLSNVYRFIDPLRNNYISTVKMDQFVDNMFNKATNFIERSYKNSDPTITQGIEWLLSILFKCDLESLFKYKSHEERRLFIANYILPMFESHATTTRDVISSARGYFTTMANRHSITEIVSISFQTHPMKIYREYQSVSPVPRSLYNKSDADVKKETIIKNFDTPIFRSTESFKLRPFEIVALEGYEISLDLRTTRLRFHSTAPKYIMYNVDIEKLIMAALYYADNHQPNEVINWHRFIYQFCILPTGIDTMNQWLINILSFTIQNTLDGVTTTEKDYEKFFNISTDNSFLFAPKSNMINSVKDLVSRVANNEITPDALLNNYGLATYSSVIEYIDHLINDIEHFPTIDQIWRAALQQLPLLMMITMLFKLNMDHPRSKSYMIKINRYLRLLLNYNLPNKVKDVRLRSYLSNSIDKMVMLSEPQ